MRARSGREDAGTCLLGVFVAAPEDDWKRRDEIAEHLGGVRAPGCATLLMQELRRVESTNTTRRVEGLDWAEMVLSVNEVDRADSRSTDDEVVWDSLRAGVSPATRGWLTRANNSAAASLM